MLNTITVRSLILISSLILLASCAKTPDVRLTLCQDLTQLLLNSPEGLQWHEHKSIIKGYQDLEMQVQFSTGEQNSKAYASCFYSYEQDEIGAETFQDPEAAYSTYPSKMILKDKAVDKILLSKSINKVMLQQGKDIINKVKKDLEQASQKAMERIKD
ncbi:MAG: hypothetical protein GQ546_13130 [Gammaproteobacteria bacterium]|nr:hypothetical protein [Gammaproteobacteria bacterium]